MSPRVQASKYQKRRRAPRIPFLLFPFDLVFKALMKEIFLFIQSFFIAKDSSHISALISKRDFFFDQGFFIRLFQSKLSLLRIVFPQFYICFPTSVI
ncbi:MAG: hypothetical protein PHW41_06105 [Eubacteriales bacterium]|nr:hypothetical protein [Eubacteriales bacterium]